MKNQRIWTLTALIFVWVLGGMSILSAQVDLDEEIENEVREALQEVEEELNALDIHVDLGGEYKNGSPKLGLYLSDLDFEEVYEKHYPYNYGVLVTGVVSGGNADRAGIIKDDIIMEFDGERVRFEDHLLNLRDSKSHGDSVSVKVFRNEKEIEVGFYFAIPTPETDEYGAPLSKSNLKKKKRLTVGYGGGGPRMVLVTMDHSNLNAFLEKNGLNPIGEQEMVLGGGFGMGNVGKGWFIGGAGAGYMNTQKVAVKDAAGALTGDFKTAKIELGYGGVTVTKKYALLTKKLVFDFTTLIGGGAMSVSVGHTDGNYSWDNKVEDMNSNSVKFQKEFFLVQPSAGLMYRVFDWAAIHGSVGYLGMYSSDDKWTDTEFDFTIDGNAPNLKDALSYSLGIWFGF